MTGNWRTRLTNNSISNLSSGDLLFVCFVLFSSSSLVFSLSGLPLNSSSCSLPAVNVAAWISCLEATTRVVLWKKVGLQNTSGWLLLPNPALRRRGDVVVTSFCTSQQRRKYLSNETPNDVSIERRQDVSVVRLHEVLLERLNDVSKRRNNDAPSLRLHDVSSKS